MLFLRGLRWRRGFSAAVLLVGVICAAVAAIGPLYARASSESTLTDELRAAAPGTGLAFTAQGVAGRPDLVARTARLIGNTVHVDGYGRPIAGLSLFATAKAAGDGASTPTTAVWRQGQCAHVVLAAGRCPQRADEAMVPAELLHSAPHWRVGERLVVYWARIVGRERALMDGPALTRVRIVGGYRPRNFLEPYWFGLPYFAGLLGPAVASSGRPLADAVLVGPGAFAVTPPTYTPPIGLPYTPEIPIEVDVDVPLVASHVRLADLGRLRRDVAAVQRRFPRQTVRPAYPAMRTDLSHALADAARDRGQVRTATLVVVLELAALSLLVLFQVVGGAVDARGDEIALAKLRGLPPWRTVVFALGEPVVLLLAAAPLGFAVALVVTRVLAGSALVAGTPVVVTAAAGAALAAAFAGSAVAAGLAAARTVTRPVLEQWRNTARPRRGVRWQLAFELVLAAAAATLVVVLRTQDATHPGAIFLLAPTLLVFAVALVGMRLLPRVGRRGLARTRASRHVAAFLALRQTVRRTGGLRLATLLAVAAGLATFAVCGEAVARANRDARAQTELGAPRRLAVQFETGHDPQRAVARADPHGRWAMASATWSPDGGPPGASTMTGRLLAVDPDRLASTMYRVRGQLDPHRLAALVAVPGPGPVTFRGTRLRVTLTTTALRGDHPRVELGIRHGTAPALRVPTTPLRTGTADYVAPVACAGGCAFTGITFDTSIDAQDVVTGAITVHALAADDGRGFVPVAAPLSRPDQWRAGEIGYGAHLRIGAAGDNALALQLHTSGASSAILNYREFPDRTPVVAAPLSTSTPSALGGVSDYSNATVAYVVTRRAKPLPDVLDTGAVADIAALRTRLPDFDRESSWSVWLGPHAPADAVARLTRAGLLVQDERTAAQRVAVLGRQGPALGLLLLLVCAIAAAVLAVGGTAVSLLADARRRSFELAALRVVGVAQRTLRRSAVAEQALLLSAAVVLGLPAGYAAAALALPLVPEFSDVTSVVLRYQPPILVALACAAAFAALLWITALVAGRALARAAVPARLREAAR